MDGYNALEEAVNYEPVMYKLLNEIERRHQKEESLVEIQQGFLDRTERMMRAH